MSNVLYIPQIDRLSEDELKKYKLSKHLPKLTKIAHWCISNYCFNDINDRDDDDDYEEHDLYIPGYQSYTFVNVSPWELDHINKWLANKSTEYNHIYITPPQKFPDADVDNWQNTCYCAAIPLEVLSEFKDFLNNLPKPTYFVQLKSDKYCDEVEDILKSGFQNNYKYFPYSNLHNVLLMSEEDVQHFIWAV